MAVSELVHDLYIDGEAEIYHLELWVEALGDGKPAFANITVIYEGSADKRARVVVLELTLTEKFAFRRAGAKGEIFEGEPPTFTVAIEVDSSGCGAPLRLLEGNYLLNIARDKVAIIDVDNIRWTEAPPFQRAQPTPAERSC